MDDVVAVTLFNSYYIHNNHTFKIVVVYRLHPFCLAYFVRKGSPSLFPPYLMFQIRSSKGKMWSNRVYLHYELFSLYLVGIRSSLFLYILDVLLEVAHIVQIILHLKNKAVSMLQIQIHVLKLFRPQGFIIYFKGNSMVVGKWGRGLGDYTTFRILSLLRYVVVIGKSSPNPFFFL